MRSILLIISIALSSFSLISQQVQSPAFDTELQGLLSLNTEVVSVDEISHDYQNYIFLDAREPNEYLVSHIPNAIHIGYNRWDKSILTSIPKSAKIIVYCSVGYRSEKITQKIQDLGYTDVSNLYGSIFEWANCNLPLENATGATTAVHTYNRTWSQWVTNPKITKLW